MLNPSWFIAFVTPGKLKTYTIKGNTFKHFRYNHRTFLYLSKNFNFEYVRWYPARFQGQEVSLFTEFDSYNAESIVGHKTLLDHCGNSLYIYHDVNFNLDQGLMFTHVDKGMYRYNDTEYHYRDGFETFNGNFDTLTCFLSTCFNCGQRLAEDECFYSEITGESYCDSCYHELFYVCDMCNTELSRKDMIVWDDDYYCNCCAKKHLFNCYYCDEWDHLDNITMTSNGESFCETCADRLLFYCESCEEYYEKQYTEMVMHEQAGVICGNCYQDLLAEEAENTDEEADKNEKN
jgi:hypothetical protein